MATIIFNGPVLAQQYRVVDNGPGTAPRILVEVRLDPDAMGGHGWSIVDPIPRQTLEGLLLASGVIH